VGDDLSGRRTVEAYGLVVAPGFIDIHTHADFTLRTSPAATTQLAQGVTTLVGGNCGYSPFPSTALNRATAGGDARFAPGWPDLAAYASAVRDARPAVNLVLQVGHNTVRSAVLGMADRAPDDAELEQMSRLVAAAAQQGAYGFSTGLAYAPGTFASSAEVGALVVKAARHGLLYSTHLRNETDGVLDAVDEAIAAARHAGARLEISHLKGMGPAAVGLARTALSRIHAARAEGLDVGCDVYPYTASSTSLLSRLPAWALDGGAEAVARRIEDPTTRARIVEALQERFGRDTDPDGIVLADLGPGPFVDQGGQSVTELARALGVTPAEVVVRVVAAHGDAGIVNHAIAEEDLDHVLADPVTAVGSDGWILDAEGTGLPHPRSFGTFSRVLGSYVREQTLLPLEEAVRKMTSLPASRIGLADRGRIAVGLAADLTVFDPSRISDTATYDRPWQLSVGTDTVFVNGTIAWSAAAGTGERPGIVLRRPRTGL
jgi:N-acyl-D-amino-acid deacylase